MVELYHKMACPFSAKVRSAIADRGLESEIVYHDIVKEKGAVQELERLSGRQQVPCLVVDGSPMLESDDIIEWIETNM